MKSRSEIPTKSKFCVIAVGMTAITGLSLTAHARAQAHPDRQSEHRSHRYPHYRLVDVGTFGGPNSQFSTPSSKVVNKHGTAVGIADTATDDPNCYFDCLVDHAFVWKDGKITALASLPGGQSAFAYLINENGLIIGSSQIGDIDPLTGLSELRGAVWRNGRVSELGTLGGNSSDPLSANDLDQVVGAATNGTPDPFANVVMGACKSDSTSTCDTFPFSVLFTPTNTETHAVLWHHGVVQDLGTLGGPDSTASVINNRGEVSGYSYTSFTANVSSGTPTVDAFYWTPRDGMINIGGLGGTFSAPFWISDRGEVVGASNLAGDAATHPFLWSKWRGMTDLGSLGGHYGHADWVNDAGDVVGTSAMANGHLRAFFWHAGKMTNLGTIGMDPASEATSINTFGQVVGGSFDPGVADLHGFLWEDGGALVDLNSLIEPRSGITVVFATDINDQGEIAGTGMLPNGDTHAILLVPCDDSHGY